VKTLVGQQVNGPCKKFRQFNNVLQSDYAAVKSRQFNKYIADNLTKIQTI